MVPNIARCYAKTLTHAHTYPAEKLGAWVSLARSRRWRMFPPDPTRYRQGTAWRSLGRRPLHPRIHTPVAVRVSGMRERERERERRYLKIGKLLENCMKRSPSLHAHIHTHIIHQQITIPAILQYKNNDITTEHTKFIEIAPKFYDLTPPPSQLRPSHLYLRAEPPPPPPPSISVVTGTVGLAHRAWPNIRSHHCVLNNTPA